MARIELVGLTKRYRHLTAVDDLTATIEPGRVTGFVGANGAGKSTTMRMVLGLTRPTAGRALIDGRPYLDLPQPTRAIGALVDPHVFHPNRSGRDSLRVVARASGIPDARVDALLDLVDLTDHARHRTGGYSTGMRQRLALATALLGDPDTLLLDEPGNGLDPQGIRWLRSLIRDLAGQGRTVLVSSHQLAELAHAIDDVLIIEHGRLVAHAPIADLLDRAATSSLEDVYLDLIEATAASTQPTKDPGPGWAGRSMS